MAQAVQEMFPMILALWILSGWACHLYWGFKEKIWEDGFGVFGFGGFLLMFFPAAVAGPFTWLSLWLEP